MLRIGPLRRIDKRLLPHSLHCCQAKGSGDATAELNDMLRNCTSASEAAIIRQELAEVSSSSLSAEHEGLNRKIPLQGLGHAT